MGRRRAGNQPPARSTAAVCRGCGRGYVADTQKAEAAACCGSITCTAITTWGDDQWAGRARMAEAAAAAGLPPSRLDSEALRRRPRGGQR